MGWSINCVEKCGCSSYATNIVDLISNHRDESGWFIVSECKHRGYIEKNFNLQEEGQTWDPFLLGIINLGDDSEIYQPFVFMVSDEPTTKADAVWFSYYKDTRPQGGRLKLGYGPGGPPVLSGDSVIQLLKEMYKNGLVSREDILSTV